MSDLLFDRARALGGVFTWNDATTLGVRADKLSRLVDLDVVLRVGPRAYALADVVRAAGTPEEKHRLKALAVVRSFEGRVAASHHSALALFGLPFWDIDDTTVQVCRIAGRSSRCRDQLGVHEAYPGEATVRDEATATPTVRPALAVIGVAMRCGEVSGIVAADAALHRGLTTRHELHAWLDRLSRRPGLTAARHAVAMADHRSESVGESRTRLLLRAMSDLPPLTMQHEFMDEQGIVWARSDFLVGEHLVVEFDGRVKYRADPGAADRRPEDVVWAEKRREDRIRSEGKVVVRVIWSDLDRPHTVHARVRLGLREVERLHGR